MITWKVLISSCFLFFVVHVVLTDVKLNLQETDYSGFLQEEVRLVFAAQYSKTHSPKIQALSSLSPSFIGIKCREKLAQEFVYLRSLAVEPMATFLDYIT